MYEIELKAWLYDRPKTINALSTFAEFQWDVEKSDTYWKLESGKDGKPISVRIREEVFSYPDGKTEKTSVVTYKKKEVRSCNTMNSTNDQTGFEVNQEYEFEISNSADFVLILEDSGYILNYTKKKSVKSYKFEDCHIELCLVDKLGDFIEIETFAETNNTEVTQKKHHQLLSVLERCGVTENDIELRYYSEMLKEEKNNVSKS